MAITFLEAGTDATFGLQFYTSSVGAATSDSSVVHTGTHSLRLASGTGLVQKTDVCQDAGTRISFWVNPPYDVGDIVLIRKTGGGTAIVKISVGFSAPNTFLQLILNASTFNGSTILSSGTEQPGWSQVTLAYTITSTAVNEFRLYLNNVLEITASNVTLADTAGVDISFLGAGTKPWYYDDIYVDNSSALTDPGDIRVTAKLPASNNVNNFNTAIGANPANRWTNVNERALSETNGWEETALSAVEETYGIEVASSGDVNISGADIIGRTAWIWAKEGTGGLGSPKLVNNGTDVAVVLTATPALYTNVVTSSAYPATQGIIGMKSAGALDTTFLYECGMLIAYAPASGGTTTYSLLSIGR